MKWTEIIGKTITKVNTKHACNIVILYFDDNTEVYIDTEAIGMGIYCPALFSPEKINGTN